MNKELLLELKNVSAGYGEIQVLRDVSFAVDEGEIVALMGPNGAGKSTVLKAMFGLIPHTGGVYFEGRKISAEPLQYISMGVVFVPQGKRVFPNLSVDENIAIGAHFVRDRAEMLRRKENIYHLFPTLKAKAKQSAGTLSGGQQQLVAIARGLMAEPKLLLLDEPTIGLSPKIVKEIFAVIKDINTRRKTAIVVVEHNIASLLPITDRAYVLNHGQIVYTGTGAEVLNSDILARVFSGKLEK